MNSIKETLYAEIIFSEVAMAFEIETLDVAPAIKVKGNGEHVAGILMSDLNQNSNNTKLLSLSEINYLVDKTYKPTTENNLSSALKTLKEYKGHLLSNGASEVYFDKNIINYLKQMIFMDYLTHNVDKHDQNVAFLVQRDENNVVHIKAAKMFDNESSFLFNQFAFSIKNGKPINLAGMAQFDNFFSLYEFGDTLNDQDAYNKQIYEAVKKDELFQTLYQKAASLNIDEVLKGISKRYEGFEIPKKYLEAAKQLLQFKIDKLTLCLKCEKELEF